MALQLSEIEARVLGALVEKEITTPEYYPLSLNALLNACNQKSNREPAMMLEEKAVEVDEVQPPADAYPIIEAALAAYSKQRRKGFGK